MKGKDNIVADHLSRPVRVVMRPSETSWLGLDKSQYTQKQSEDAVWGELREYLKGGKLPSKRLPKTNRKFSGNCEFTTTFTAYFLKKSFFHSHFLWLSF